MLRFTHSQKGVLVRNRCVKFAFNNGSFGANLPAYCEPIKGRFCCYSCLLQSFIKSIMPAYRSIRCSLFANALLSLACCWRWCSVLPCSYCSENLLFYGLKELSLSFYGLRKFPYTLTICAVCLPVLSVVGLSIQWLNVALWGYLVGCHACHIITNKKGCRKIYDTPSCLLKGSHLKSYPLSCLLRHWIVSNISSQSGNLSLLRYFSASLPMTEYKPSAVSDGNFLMLP